MAVELEELLVKDAAEWRAWLERHHAESPGVWLVLHKKGGAVTELDYEAALQEALCFGWIDGQGRRRDEESSFQRMTRRGPKSVWSARNVERIGRLEAAGRMAPAGPRRRRQRQGGRPLGSRLLRRGDGGSARRTWPRPSRPSPGRRRCSTS